MAVEERVSEAEDELEGWIKDAVEEAQREVFGGDSTLTDDDLRKINELHREMRERGEDGIWGNVEYQIYRSEDDGEEVVALDTFGVPRIPEDADVPEDDRERYNTVLSEYGVELSQRVERQFEEWRG
ncbi:MAG: DUF7539 family protein [Halobacteriota archaeon]